MSTNWSNLIYDVKQQIIGLLDYESRCNLRICSKSDKIHVDSVKFIASKFEIREIDSENDYEKTHIRVDVDNFTIWFIGKNKFTKVDRRWNGELQSDLEEIKTELRFDVAKRYIDKFMVKGGVLAANRFRIELIKFTPLKHWRIECPEMVFNETPSVLRWLRQSSPSLTKLHISKVLFESLKGLETLPQMTNTSESLRVSCDASIPVELLRAVRAPDLQLKSHDINVEGMKVALDRFLRIGRRRDTLCIYGQFRGRKSVAIGGLVKGLMVKGEQSSDEFDEESDDIRFQILGGYTNIHGLQETRHLFCYFVHSSIILECELLQKPEREACLLTPFTNQERNNIGRSTLP